MQKTQEVQFLSLSWEDPLEKEMATHSSIFEWKIPWAEELDRLQSMGLGCNELDITEGVCTCTRTHTHTHTHTHTPQPKA